MLCEALRRVSEPLGLAAASCLALSTAACGGESTTRGGSSDDLWTDLGETTLDPASTRGPHTYRTFEVNEEKLRKLLDSAPFERSGRPRSSLELPRPDGEREAVDVEETEMLSPDLQAANRDIATYRAQGVSDPHASGRLDQTGAGFHAMLIGEHDTLFVDPARDGDSSHYIAYWRSAVPHEPFDCLTQHEHEGEESIRFRQLGFPATNPSGDDLSTYRLAISTTVEYTTFHGGITGAMNNVTTSMNRINGIYEREVALTMQLVATNIRDVEPDGFTGNDVGALMNENQTQLDTVVGTANYDIGHVFSAGGNNGVVAGGARACNAGKARGATSNVVPNGDVFDVDYVAHEMGHQFSAMHTWNANVGACSGSGQYVQASAYEPGSATTIMGYAGICGAQDVQPNSNDYFHTRSYDEIVSHRDGAGACAVVTPTGNTPPSVEAEPNCTIPQETPFRLTAQGNDADGDGLTFTWEQFDQGSEAIRGFPVATNTSGPLFRSRQGTSDPSRTFPQLSDILSGATPTWEVLPAVDRVMNFRVSVRDNRAGGGGVDYDSMVVTVSGTPFRLTAPAGGTLECGASVPIQWDVGGGSVAPNVDILLSVNGGTVYTPLVTGTANDGSEAITVPGTFTTGGGRIALEPTTECFFAISSAFSIADTLDPTITAPGDVTEQCASPTGTTVNLGVPTVNDQCDAALSVANNAPATFPLGTTVVDWTATDDAGNSAGDSQSVTIVDTTPPAFTSVPADITTTTCGSLNIGTATAEDLCGGVVTVTNNQPATFPPGTTTVTWTATDERGLVSTATQRVTVTLGDNPACCPAGTNVILGTPNNDNLNGTGGSDCILGRGAQDTINGLGGNDFISGGDGNDTINGGSGSDVVFAGSGQDSVVGGSGNDNLNGGDGDDNVQGGSDNDTLSGGQGQDTLLGQDGNDRLFGDTGFDNLQGGNGNDDLVGGDANDTCDGGAGTNTFASCEFGAPNSCIDGVQNGTETDLDCGGGCPDCEDGDSCGTGSDCDGGAFCVGGVCTSPPGGGNLFETELTFSTDWGGGYCAVLNVTNNNTVPTTGWTVTIDTNASTIFDSWNGNFSAMSGVLDVTPALSGNTVVDPDETDSSVGFCANRTVPFSGTLPFVVSSVGLY